MYATIRAAKQMMLSSFDKAINNALGEMDKDFLVLLDKDHEFNRDETQKTNDNKSIPLYDQVIAKKKCSEAIASAAFAICRLAHNHTCDQQYKDTWKQEIDESAKLATKLIMEAHLAYRKVITQTIQTGQGDDGDDFSVKRRKAPSESSETDDEQKKTTKRPRKSK